MKKLEVTKKDDTEDKRNIKQRLKNITKNESFQAIVDSFAGIMVGMFLMQVMLLLIGVTLIKTMFVLQLIGMTITYLSYFLFKDEAKSSHKKIGNRIIQISPLVFTLSVVLTTLRKLVVSMSDSNVNPVPMVIMITIGVVAAYIVMLSKDETKDFFAKLEENVSVFDENEDKHANYDPGDMIIGKKYDIEYLDNGDKRFTETDEDVILPLKDRYLHMLIIGPTGSGKTAQVLIPQINRDIQVKDLGLIVLEPKGDLAEQVYAMAEYYGRNDAEYFNPTHPDCPYFNPLSGPEDEVIENMTTTFKTLAKGSSTFFEDQGEMLIRRSLSVLKRMEKDPKAREHLYGDEATLIDLSTLIHNNESKGRRMVTAFSKIPVTSDELQKETDDIASWFLSDYFTGSNAADTRGATKTYEHTSGMRNQVAKLVSNVYLRNVLNPPKGYSNEVDFAKSLEEGRVLALTTNQGTLRDLGRFLGYFLILQLQSAIFKRPGNEDTRRGTMLFIDEFQVYANEGFEDMLTQGRSYRVACHLATQAIDQISTGDSQGKRFLAVVKTNARNLIAFPDLDPGDAKWFSENFGEVMVSTTRRGESQQKASLGNFANFRPVNESINVSEELQPRLTASDIMSRKFGEISYKIMRENNVHTPGVAKVEFIPWEFKLTLDDIVNEYNEKLDETMNHEKYGYSSFDSEPHESLTPVYNDEEPAVVEPEIPESNNPYEGFLNGSDDDLDVGSPIERGNYVQDNGTIEDEF